jgi:hypothetical protein
MGKPALAGLISRRAEAIEPGKVKHKEGYLEAAIGGYFRCGSAWRE